MENDYRDAVLTSHMSMKRLVWLAVTANLLALFCVGTTKYALPATSADRIVAEMHEEGFGIAVNTVERIVFSDGVRGATLVGIPLLASTILLLVALWKLDGSKCGNQVCEVEASQE